MQRWLCQIAIGFPIQMLLLVFHRLVREELLNLLPLVMILLLSLGKPQENLAVSNVSLGAPILQVQLRAFFLHHQLNSSRFDENHYIDGNDVKRLRNPSTLIKSGQRCVP